MPRGLRRIHGGGNLHFITTSCYQWEPRLRTARARDIFLKIFEQVRKSYGFEVIGFVVMPEHVHLLISEPQRNTVPIVLQVLKQRVAVRLLPKPKLRSQRELWETTRQRFWQRRYYDFNVYSDRKVAEKLSYMHGNPVKRGLVASPELWPWSSSRAFTLLEEGVVKLNWQTHSVNGKRRVQKPGIAKSIAAHPPKTRGG